MFGKKRRVEGSQQQSENSTWAEQADISSSNESVINISASARIIEDLDKDECRKVVENNVILATGSSTWKFFVK